MNSLRKFLKIPRQTFTIPFSSSSSSQNVDPVDVLSSDEIDLEVK